MARKKPRSPQRGNPPAGAITTTTTTPATTTAISGGAPPKKPLTANGTPDQPLPKKGLERHWIDATGIRLARILGSLQLAISLLSLFTLSVLVGTLMEHYYSTKIAQVLIYKAWWFALVLLLLSVNIFFAAAKKWPWKAHQTGFVVTHIGLITMLTGGILNAVGGVDAQMELLDTNDIDIQQKAGRAYGVRKQTSDTIRYSEIAQIRFREGSDDNPHGGQDLDPLKGDSNKKSGKQREEDFEPGPLPWNSHPELAGKTDLFMSILTWLQNPLGRHWSVSLSNNATLEVIDFLPHTRREPYSAAPPDKRGLPAIKVRMRSAKQPMAGGAMEEWLALEGKKELNLSGAILELVGVAPPELIPEFLAPPPLEKLGKQGVLVFVGPGGRTPIPVDAATGWVSLPDGGKVRVKRYFPDFFHQDDKHALPVVPSVEFEYDQGGRVTEYFIVGKLIGSLLEKQSKRPVLMGLQGVPLVWYQPADVLNGQANIRGLVQFVQSQDQSLHYRSFTNNQDKVFALESSGEVKAHTETPVWKKMDFRFQIVEHLPRAVPVERFIPVAITPGKETQEEKLRYSPAIRCRLSLGKNTKEFWVGFGDTVTPELDGRTFTVRYLPKTKKLPFEIKLERAETTVDPGTGSAATYTSFVRLYDKEQNINGEQKVITMNQPLEHRGYMVYQSTLESLPINDANKRPVSFSGFTVGSDPGLWLKYLGSLCLGLGIFLMFYMKSYFITGRRVSPPPVVPVSLSPLPPQPT